MDLTPNELWQFLVPGYLFTILIETPVLLVGLSPRHSLGRRLFAGVWLTACTYPIVVLVMPLLLEPKWFYLTVAETFAPVAECALFWVAFGLREDTAQLEADHEEGPHKPTLISYSLSRLSTWWDFAAITIANLASFGLGELMDYYQWFGLRG